MKKTKFYHGSTTRKVVVLVTETMEEELILKPWYDPLYYRWHRRRANKISLASLYSYSPKKLRRFADAQEYCMRQLHLEAPILETGMLVVRMQDLQGIPGKDLNSKVTEFLLSVPVVLS